VSPEGPRGARWDVDSCCPVDCLSRGSGFAKLEALGARIIHVYGLTETHGPYSLCEWQPGWPDLDVPARAKLLSRQGVGMIQADRLRVVDKDMHDVRADGETMGEIVMR
jgi:fatty-acyl-CoA synthase